MSWSPCPDPVLGDRQSTDAIETLIIPRAVDLGEMEVRRALPSVKRQMVGPFICFDQMGRAPVRMAARTTGLNSTSLQLMSR